MEGFLLSILIDSYLKQEVHNTHYTNYKPTNISFDRPLHRLIRSHILTYFPDSFLIEKKIVGTSVNPYIGLSRSLVRISPVLGEKPEAILITQSPPYVTVSCLVSLYCSYILIFHSLHIFNLPLNVW